LRHTTQQRTGSWTDGNIVLMNSASFINDVSGSFVFSAVGTVTGSLGVQMVNRGLVTGQGASAQSRVLVDFQNYGSIVVAQGTLAVAAGTNWNTISVQSGGILSVDSPSNGVVASYFFDRSSKVTVAGQLLVNSGSLIVSSTYDASGGRTTVVSGTLDVRYALSTQLLFFRHNNYLCAVVWLIAELRRP
jgi:hypothetical protein